jgi:hypothetical protein
MHVVTRTYQGTELANAVIEKKSEIEQLMKQVPGFISWVCVRFSDGGMQTATVCQDKGGCDKSIELAREWVSKNVPSITPGSVQIRDGEVLVRIT